jgi:predicted RNA-binding protein with RPS1 domain
MPQMKKTNELIEGSTHDFVIKSFEDKKINDRTRNIITVETFKDEFTTVIGFSWQTKDIWNFPTLICQIEKIYANGAIKLKNIDYRHPIYQVGQAYEFNVIGNTKKKNKDGEFDVFQLRGEDGCTHEVNMLIGQKIKKAEYKVLKCSILKITHRLHLHQIKLEDHLFVDFEKIVPEKELKNKYFTPELTNKHYPEDSKKLQNQYESKSAFWTITYTDAVLPRLLREHVKRLDYKQAFEINKMIIIFEEWILSKGILTSFSNRDQYNITKRKANTQLKNAQIKNDVLLNILNNGLEAIDNKTFFENEENSVERLYFLLQYSDIGAIDGSKIISVLHDIILTKKNNLPKTNPTLYKLLQLFHFRKKEFTPVTENFSLYTSYQNEYSLEKKDLKYLQLCFAEIMLSDFTENSTKKNITTGQLLRFFTRTKTNIKEKETLLLAAYKYFENLNHDNLPIPFFLGNKKITVDFNALKDDLENNLKLDTLYLELKQNSDNSQTIEVKLTKKSKNGFEVNYKNIQGFLPNNFVSDKFLKKHDFENHDFENNDITVFAKCFLLSREFNFFIIKQDESYPARIKNELNFEMGKVYEGKIKSIQNYGLFITTKVGEGLVRLNEILDIYWSGSKIHTIFKIGDKVKVVLKDFSTDKKPNLSIFRIKEIDLDYYKHFCNRIINYGELSDSDEENADSEIEYKKELELNLDEVLKEKALCIEQYASICTNKEVKLIHYKIAKQLYSNSNNARSFLLNTYISYFELINEFEILIGNEDISSLSHIKNKSNEIIGSFSEKTLETFPECNKLLSFLEIVSLFNEFSNEALGKLFNYVQKYHDENTARDLRTVAKITLANNLLASETDADKEFLLKNIKLIFNYLSVGFLSLEETLEDKNAKELKEERLYILEKIKGDENETMEFKSSFISPILSDKQFELLKSLEQSEKTESNKIAISKINGDLAKKAIIHSALKTLAAFANSEGGTLLIGVTDRKEIIGLNTDYQSLSKDKDKYRDKFGLFFDSKVKEYLGDGFSSLMTKKFIAFENRDILFINVKKSNQEVFLKINEEGKAEEQLFIRNLSSTVALSGSSLATFIKNKHLKQLK